MEEKDNKNNTNYDMNYARELAINSIHPNCKEIASKFFECMEDNFKKYQGKDIEYADFEKEVFNDILPKCMISFDLDSCMKKYE